MVSFNQKDDNMPEIARLSKLAGVDTKNEYRIYGLEQQGNHPVLFSGQESGISAEQEKVLMGFLTANNIDSATEDVESSNKKIFIGIRRDLRDSPEMVARLVETFVWYLEGKLDIPADFKVGIDSFKA